jgi:hypothetical protein
LIGLKVLIKIKTIQLFGSHFIEIQYLSNC